MDLDQFEEALMVPLPGVRVLSLPKFQLKGTERIGATFCRILSILFPNLEELRVMFDLPSHLHYDYYDVMGNYDDSDPFGVISHLNLFPKLLKHEISAVHMDELY